MKFKANRFEEARDELCSALEEAKADIANLVSFLVTAESSGQLESQRGCLNDLILLLTKSSEELDAEYDYLARALEDENLSELLIGKYRANCIAKELLKLRARVGILIRPILE